MKQTVNKYDFGEAFTQANRKDNFSYEGLGALFDHLEQYEEDTGEEIELDVIALCGDYSEYESLKAFQEDYGDEYESIEDIEQRTIVIPVSLDEDEDGKVDGSFIIQVF